ncbi:MipA/OmpV family protein [Pseudoalteromonas citrea]|uniref:MipA/OmpV family protein n=1 Tax=Pseudoalteromonas citrea TaxID=43655 RepID=A0A5S3XM50_9GAMM|nr:MipA/OmpV family protein [Pseudoalteromonas citrea]TMP40156.1 MipA/OmpV family protein [Pseudoalteromonas citrea]TMP56870.1 MipA/OmpV family protein [Pseudoalteromonas citrea]
MKKIIILFSLLLCCSFSTYASEDEYDDDGFLWQLSLGGFWVDLALPELEGAKSDFDGVSLLVDAKIQYKRFYLNTHSGDFFGGSDLGYQLVLEDDWGVDAIYGNYQLPFSEEGYYGNEGYVPELSGIKKREQDQSIGLSYYRTLGEYQAVAELVYDAFGETNGWVLHFEATRNFELRNWDLWLNFGANYYSANFIDYFYGVDADEATSRRPVYELGDSMSVFTQVQANYPIAEDWVFSAGASILIGASNTKKSPLVNSRHARAVFAGVKYVF